MKNCKELVNGKAKLNTSVLKLDGLVVLLLETKNEIIAAISQHLTDAGATVALATSINEAIETLRLTNPNIIIFSLSLERENPFSFLIRVRVDERRKDIPIIAIVSSIYIEAKMALGASCNGYITVPIIANELYQEITRVIGAP